MGHYGLTLSNPFHRRFGRVPSRGRTGSTRAPYVEDSTAHQAVPFAGYQCLLHIDADGDQPTAPSIREPDFSTFKFFESRAGALLRPLFARRLVCGCSTPFRSRSIGASSAAALNRNYYLLHWSRYRWASHREITTHFLPLGGGKKRIQFRLRCPVTS